MIVNVNLNPKRPYNSACLKYNIVSKYNNTKVSGHCFTRRIHHQTSDKCICNTQYTANCVGVRVGEGNLITGCKHSSNHSIKHME